MDKTATIEVIPKIDEEYQVAIDKYIAEMERMKEEMNERQRRIEKLQAETRAILADLKID